MKHIKRFEEINEQLNRDEVPAIRWGDDDMTAPIIMTAGQEIWDNEIMNSSRKMTDDGKIPSFEKQMKQNAESYGLEGTVRDLGHGRFEFNLDGTKRQMDDFFDGLIDYGFEKVKKA